MVLVFVLCFVDVDLELDFVEDLTLAFVVEMDTNDIDGEGTGLTFRAFGMDVTTAVGVVGTSTGVGIAAAAADVANATRRKRNIIVLFCRLEVFTFWVLVGQYRFQ